MSIIKWILIQILLYNESFQNPKSQIMGIPEIQFFRYVPETSLIFLFSPYSLCRECLLRLLLVYIVIKCPLCRTIVNPKCLMNKQPKNSVKTSKKIWTSLMKSQRFGNVRTTKKTKKKRSCWLLKWFFSLLPTFLPTRTNYSYQKQFFCLCYSNKIRLK